MAVDLGSHVPTTYPHWAVGSSRSESVGVGSSEGMFSQLEPCFHRSDQLGAKMPDEKLSLLLAELPPGQTSYPRGLYPRDTHNVVIRWDLTHSTTPGAKMASIAHRPRNTSKPYAVRYRDETGRQREASFRTKTEAKRFMTEIDHGKQNGTFTDPKKSEIRFVEYASQVLDTLAVSDGTRKLYRGMLATWIAPWANGRTLAQIAEDREGATKLINDTMRNADGQLMSFNRRGTALTVIRTVLTEAVNSGRINRHRMSDIGIQRSNVITEDSHSDFVFPEYAQIVSLAEGMNGYAMAVWLMRGCGLRIREALGVHKEHFIDGGKVLRVRQQASVNGDKAEPLKHRRPGQFRDVPVPGYLWKMVRNLPDGPICPGIESTYFSYSMVYKAFVKVRDSLGIPDGFTPHSLRHAFATALLTNGAQLHEVSQWLGHQDTAVTSRIYAHVLPSAVTSARSILDEEFQSWSK